MRQIQVRRHAIMADAVELDAQAGEPVELAIDLLHRIERCVVIDVERHRARQRATASSSAPSAKAIAATHKGTVAHRASMQPNGFIAPAILKLVLA
jgi:hypothetical protein